ncbi:MAG: hypothetical protein KF757_04930 [Phycisphaeraceae bacterium]|nr:hypothetical protein [Phycisphaeraceae bacterium]MCW5763889.1 hypothetical protein [Phycisphaeraceae bacterium]
MPRLAILLIALGTGCSPVPVGFDSPAKTKRMDAIVRAAAENDTSPRTIRCIIQELDSHDPAVRFIAIRTLERLTGQTNGYDFAALDWDREASVQAWVRWFHDTYPEHSTPVVIDELADTTHE